METTQLYLSDAQAEVTDRRRTLTEEEAVVMAIMVWIAASVAPSLQSRLTTPVSVLFVMLTIGAFVLGQMKAAMVTLACLGFIFSAQAEMGYQPIRPGEISASGMVVGDPRPTGIGWQVQTRLEGGERVELVAFGVNGFAVRKLSVGQRFSAQGRAKAADSAWEKGRHVVGSISVNQIQVTSGPPWWLKISETARNAVLDGAKHLPPDQQALYTGLVLGDDRFQPIGQRARFRAVGLSHLLAVSGQNVAFFLAIVRPGLLMVGYRSRFLLTVGFLGLFVVVTRGEPSVLRATATAGLAAWAAITGRHRSGIRLLATAVTFLVFLDPFLVDVAGFRLSVAASAGILLLAPSLRDRLPGPLVVREMLAVTTAAQLAVTPTLLYQFGPTSLAAIPANVFVGWAAAGVMVLGLTLGTVAGALPSWLGQTMQLPNRFMLWWLDALAAFVARLPMPSIGAAEFVVLVVVLLVAAMVGSRRGQAVLLTGYFTAVLFFSVPYPPATPMVLDSGAEFVPGTDDYPSVLILRSDVSASIVDELLAHRITEVDLVVTERGHRRANEVVDGVEDVTDARVILAPPQHSIRNGKRLTETNVIDTAFGELWLEVPRGRDGIGSTSIVADHRLATD